MKLQNKKGFTLIELLVVITIIGILATGATTVYTSQIQKARDTTRINDIKAIQSAVEQVYQDRAEYPPTSNYFLVDASGAGAWVSVKTYMPKIPRDPKNGQACNKWTNANTPACVYAYTTWPDLNGIKKGAYILSTAFEAEWKIKSDGTRDGWKSDRRWEVWNGLTVTTLATPDWNYDQTDETVFRTATWVSLYDWGVAGNDWTTEGLIIAIHWD